MTKEELAKRRGEKVKKENPAEKILTVNIEDKKEPEKKDQADKRTDKPKTEKSRKTAVKENKEQKDNKASAPSKKEEQIEPVAVKEPEPEAEIQQPAKETVTDKNPVGRPRKRKEGGKQMSFYLESDLVKPLYEGLGYQDSVTDRINAAIRWYIEEKGQF